MTNKDMIYIKGYLNVVIIFILINIISKMSFKMII